MRRTCCVVLVLASAATLLLYSTHPATTSHGRIFAPLSILHTEKEKAEVVDIGVVQDLGVKFLPNFKNPCWYEARGTTDQQRARLSLTATATSSSVLRFNKATQSELVLRCLPYFFLIGQPKCATTDIFHRINIHPEVVEPKLKGPHWWTRKRYGMPYADKPVTLTEYLDIFNATKIGERDETDNTTKWANTPLTSRASKRITGDGSTSTFWDSGATMTYIHSILTRYPHKQIVKRLINKRWNSHVMTKPAEKRMNFAVYEYELGGAVTDKNKDDGSKGVVLPFTVADVIHSVLPESRIIAVIREPVSRLYSSYLFFTKNANLSPEHFDDCVQRSIKKWNDCTKMYSVRTCAYNKTLQNSMKARLYNGLYSVFLEDWLRVYPRKQVLVVRMEDYHTTISTTMAVIYSHLGLRPLTADEEKRVNTAPVRNRNRKKSEIGKMLNTTLDALQKFYRPFNSRLAWMLGDSKFLWKDIQYSLR